VKFVVDEEHEGKWRERIGGSNSLVSMDEYE
jgi:hypothetical protein